MIGIELGVFFLIGLFGGAHCIGMCGPLVTLYAGRLSNRSDVPDGHLSLYEVRQHALFNLGRTLGYAVIGALMGVLGSIFFLTTDAVVASADGVRGVFGIVIGVILIIVGLGYLLGRERTLDAHVPMRGVDRVVTLLTGRVDRWVGGSGIIGLGAIHGLLPCPILYPVFLYALSTGSPTTGALSLAVLGLGTFPAVFLFGTVIESVSARQRAQLHRVLGVMFIVLGYIPLTHGLMIFGIHLPHPDIPYYQPF